MKEPTASNRNPLRALPGRGVLLALVAVTLAAAELRAQDGYGSSFPAQPNFPTAVRPRTNSGLAPIAEPKLEPIPQEAGAEAPARELPGSAPLPAEFPNPNAAPLPAPPLLPPPARMAERFPAAEAQRQVNPQPQPASRFAAPEPGPVSPAAFDSQPLTPPPAATPATVTAPAARPGNPIKLPPPGRGKPEAGEASSKSNTGWSGSIVTVITSLSIVLGLFAVVAWLMRRGMGAAGLSLPSEAVAVLGQLPLTGRQQILLVRIGPKLLLVSTNGETSSTLTEIEEPDEVDRIVGLCAETQPHSTTQTFRSLLAQMSTEPAAGGFLGDTHRHTRDLASSGAPARDD